MTVSNITKQFMGVILLAPPSREELVIKLAIAYENFEVIRKKAMEDSNEPLYSFSQSVLEQLDSDYVLKFNQVSK